MDHWELVMVKYQGFLIKFDFFFSEQGNFRQSVAPRLVRGSSPSRSSFGCDRVDRLPVFLMLLYQ